MTWILLSVFLFIDSEPNADTIADKVMVALGGQEAYEQTQFISWRFFGRRYHVWDKWTGDYRMESENELVLMNLNTKEGRVWVNNELLTNEDEIKTKLQGAYEAWINDSYWLVMPYKLKDSGVTLVYSGEGETTDGLPSYLLTLTFENVGVTPDNKYVIYVDKETHLVRQWDFYAKADDAEPRFQIPWNDWQTYGQIKLSGDRGRAKLTDIAVHETLPKTVFSEPAAIELVKE